jgi:hypothetical protein
MTKCAICGIEIQQTPKKRAKLYCSETCRSRAYYARYKGQKETAKLQSETSTKLPHTYIEFMNVIRVGSIEKDVLMKLAKESKVLNSNQKSMVYAKLGIRNSAQQGDSCGQRG